VAKLTVNIPVVAPAIATQPQSVTVTVGQTVQFSVIATGTAPLSYQWQRNTQTILGATSATYAIASAQLADAGDYRVDVGNAAGNVTSQVAKLTVNIPVVAPAITAQPQPETVTVGHHEQPKSAYTIERDRYELPDPGFELDELAAGGSPEPRASMPPPLHRTASELVRAHSGSGDA
jgi:hypothetical protein